MQAHAFQIQIWKTFLFVHKSEKKEAHLFLFRFFSTKCFIVSNTSLKFLLKIRIFQNQKFWELLLHSGLEITKSQKRSVKGLFEHLWWRLSASSGVDHYKFFQNWPFSKQANIFWKSKKSLKIVFIFFPACDFCACMNLEEE